MFDDFYGRRHSQQLFHMPDRQRIIVEEKRKTKSAARVKVAAMMLRGELDAASDQYVGCVSYRRESHEPSCPGHQVGIYWAAAFQAWSISGVVKEAYICSASTCTTSTTRWY